MLVLVQDVSRFPFTHTAANSPTARAPTHLTLVRPLTAPEKRGGEWTKVRWVGARAVGDLAAVCVKSKRETSCTKTTNMYEGLIITLTLDLKGIGHYWQLLKIIFGIKPFLVTNNGERLMVWNIMTNGSLWSGVVFKKKVIFHKFDFETSKLRYRNWGLEIKHLKAHNFLWQGCFFFHYYLATPTTNWVQIFTG